MNYSERSDTRLQLKATRGWAVHWACTHFNSCISIFKKNGDELLRYLKNLPQMPLPFLLPDDEARLTKIDSDVETNRLLHNYAASAKTLVDHSRIFQKNFLSIQSKEVYKKWVEDSFARNPRAQIIQNLRNYVLYVDLPTICSMVTLSTGNVRLTLIPNRLLEWNGWKPCVKFYLKELSKAEENLPLEELVFEYTEKKLSISNWLLKEVVASNRVSLTEFYRGVRQITESAKAEGLVTDPLVVNFFLPQTREKGI